MSLHTLEDGLTVVSFGDRLTSSRGRAIDEGQSLSDANGAPVGICERDGWYTVCEHAPETLDPSPEFDGWELVAVVDPMDTDDEVVR